jgi:hypothetical protein
MTHSLLIIACSQRKVAGPKARAAWDVYDGVVYRMLKKRLGPRSQWPDGLDVLIVSARYGVIRPGRKIHTYDQTMPMGQPGRWAGKLQRLVAGCNYGYIHVNLGRAYQTTIGDVAVQFPKAEVTFATGGIGQRVAQTAAWVAGRLNTRQIPQPSSSRLRSADGSQQGTRRRNLPDGIPPALS